MRGRDTRGVVWHGGDVCRQRGFVAGRDAGGEGVLGQHGVDLGRDHGRSRPHTQGHGDWVESVAWSPDGRQVATGSEDTTARIWDATMGEVVRVLTAISSGAGGRSIASPPS